MCVTRSYTTATWSKASRPRAPSSWKSSTRFPIPRRPSFSPRMACRSRFPRRPRSATCPLVTKVHREAEIHHKRGREIVLIGHADHPEVVGTVGQLPTGAITLIQSVDEVARFMPRDPGRLAYVTQTTLSV